jgi:hypothetical protein
VVLGVYYQLLGVGSGGTTLLVPNPVGVQVCTNLVPGYLNQTFDVKDNQITNISLSGTVNYNTLPETGNKYWFTTTSSTPGSSSVSLFNESGFPFISEPEFDTYPADSICLDGVVTTPDPQGAVATTLGNHTINLVTSGNICDPVTPALNLNVLANTNYKNFRNYYQNQNLLTGFVLNISSSPVSTGTTTIITKPTPVTSTTPLTNNTAPNTPNSNVLANSNQTTVNQPTQDQTPSSNSQSAKPAEVAGIKDKVDFDRTAPTELIRTGGFVQNGLGILSILALISILTLVILSNIKA